MPEPWFAPLVGREDSPATDWNPMLEQTRWIGKPWRRIELLRRRHFYKGECVDEGFDLTVHVGSRRLGLGFTLILMRQTVLDYSDEPNQ